MNVFENFGLSQELQTTIRGLGYVNPTQIQGISIPKIIKGEDVIGESATGSGKTLAFGCGIVEKVIPGQGLQALIITPTRELTEQVKESIKILSRQKHLNVISIYGGVSIDPQIHGLSRADVVVATPGRLLDHLRRGTITTNKIKILVLDEADRMFDMGFIDDIEQIIQQCPKQRQTLFFSATISGRVKDLARNYMIRPSEVSAQNQVDPAKLKQVYYDVPKHQKLSLLIHLLQSEKSGLAMVFCNTRKTTDFVIRNLKANRISSIAIHGGLSQNKRTHTIKSFNDAKFGVLVCTDVAARGLHIENVSHVFNYEIPKDTKDYVHRIGRTARAGEYGKVINLLCEYDYDNFSRVLNDYRQYDIKSIDIPQLPRIIIQKDEFRRPQGRRNFPPRNGPRNGRRR